MTELTKFVTEILGGDTAMEENKLSLYGLRQGQATGDAKKGAGTESVIPVIQ